MAVNNSLVAKSKKPSFTLTLTSESVKRQINNIVGGKNADKFITSIISAVQTNPALQECENMSIVNAALLGEALKLSPSPQLGQYYMVPFNNTKKGCKEAQFQLGYKGYIQLAIRSGQYKKINVLAIKQGELIKYDPLEETIEVNLIEDEVAREQAPTAGYYAMFEYTNGFRKTLYWSRQKMESHASHYSKGYAAHKGYTFWEKDFDGMALKTMLRQLISKWGIMSIDLQTAIEADQAVIKDDGSKDYVDTQDITEEDPVPQPPQPEIVLYEQPIPQPPMPDFPTQAVEEEQQLPGQQSIEAMFFGGNN